MNTCSVHPLVIGGLALPLLAACGPVVAAPASESSTGAAAQQALPSAVIEKTKLDEVWAQRREARSLAERGERSAAASRWRTVLHLLRQMEGKARGARLSSAEQALRAEAEREVRLAQSDLSTLWQVSDVVTLAADSRTILPADEVRPHSNVLPSRSPVAEVPPVATVRASARATAIETEHFVSTRSLVQVPQVLEITPLKSLPKPLRRAAPFGHAQVRAAAVLRVAPGMRAVEAKVFKPLGVPRSERVQGSTSSTPRARVVGPQALRPLGLGASRVTKGRVAREQAALRWAQSQWWARPLVQRGSDSRNMALSGLDAVRPDELSLPWASAVAAPTTPPILLARVPQLAPRALPLRFEASGAMSAALAVASRPTSVATAPAQPKAQSPRPIRGRSWTIEIRVPTAIEAASAVRALGSQP